MNNMQLPRADVLIIDDEAAIREGCRQTLESEGYRALVAQNGDEGLRLVEKERPRVVLLDLRMPGISGVEVLEKLPGIDPRIIPIVITGYGTIDTAVASMKLGAFDFINKPFDPDQLLATVNRGIHRYEEAAQTFQVSQVTAAPPRPVSQEDVLLQGLEAITQSYALGLGEDDLRKAMTALEPEAAYHAQKRGQIKERKTIMEELVADLRLVDRIIERYDFRKNALIQILLEVQKKKNWLPQHVLLWTSRRLNIPLPRIYEIVHFYEMFSLEPQGRHTIQVCLGTACHVRKAPELLTTISATLGIKPGETDKKQLFTLKTVNCLGCCALAPVMKIDDTYYSNPSFKQLKKIFKDYEKESASNITEER
jgi:NADH-quinone oxidoreductase subunit E